ncbi:hypothetical protein PGT21_030546 [Puccinia graminis f. sp. tritici]|uniref:DUF7729 domain-containing protein n=1 Tax=Puccinia graminis f. sp. tritici TaxID=56615 RepID=A0A5B0NZV9_PUCGR|nr:hypothetical protein PGTUg99_018198 [Puccinia graminis f. sp. tritici]KAA1094805.1 hypothetical protein PGT21_030546 [Puccinia graminis f. sp. tritici]
MILHSQCIPNQACRRSKVKNTWIVLAAATAALISSPSLVASTEKLRTTSSSTAPTSRSPTILASLDTTSYTPPSKTRSAYHYQYPISQQQQQFPIIPNHPLSASNSIKSTHDPWRPFDDSTLQAHPVHLQAQKTHLEAQPRHLAKRQQVASDNAKATPSFPEPFDTSLGTEFDSETCEPFISQFLKNTAFQQCHPFSLLLTTSEGFYQAGRALNTVSVAANQSDSVNATILPINQVIDASCKADPDQCQVLFDQLSSNIKSPRFGCGKDLEKNNSLALQALTGLSSYRLMREVACLTTRETPKAGKTLTANPNKNLTTTALAGQRTSPGLVAANSTGGSTEPSTRYCFVNAMSSQNPDDLYYYYLPLGTSLPSGTQPSCNECTKSLMKLYALSVSTNDLTLHESYPSARAMTNSKCGPGFAPMPSKDANRLASAAIQRFACIAWNVQACLSIVLVAIYMLV